MTFDANPRSRSLLRRVASIVCLLAVILLTLPCSATPGPTLRAAAHDCCLPTSGASLNAPALCCSVHPQQAELASTHALPLLTVISSVDRSDVVENIRKLIHAARPTRPPLLHPILRI